MPDPHREHSRREHRVLAQFLAIEAWLRGADCIALTRRDLESYLGLERLKSARVEWIQEDVKPWFPYQEIYYASNSESSLYDIFLSRVPIENHLPDGTMATKERIAAMRKDAPITQIFSHRYRFPSEARIVGYLAQLCAGLAAPKRRKRGRQKLANRAFQPARKKPRAAER